MSDDLTCPTCGYMWDTPNHELGCVDGARGVIRHVVREMVQEILQEKIDKEVFRG